MRRPSTGRTVVSADRLPRQTQPAVSSRRLPKPASAATAQFTWGDAWPQVVVGGLVLGAVFLWSYWPTLLALVQTWNREPDYSHGYCVVPIALYMLYARRDKFPQWSGRIAWGGISLIALSLAMRYAAAIVYFDALDGWSISVWCAGVVWLLAGRSVLWWSLPSILFLYFMLPLPFRAEQWLRQPLQRIATELSAWSLQCLGQPALAEGNTIFLNDVHLEIEEACSGLRILVAIAAIAFTYVILARRPRWQNAVLLAATLPIAITTNCVRVVATGLLFQFVSGEAAQTFTHDLAGWLMIPLAALLFWVTLWYTDRLFWNEQAVDVTALAFQPYNQQ